MNEFIINQSRHFYSALQAVSYVNDIELRDLLYREVLATQASVREAMNPEQITHRPRANGRRKASAEQVVDNVTDRRSV